MLYIETGSTSANYNFALEHYLMFESGIDVPVFLLWRTTPTLMLGRFQNIAAEINTKYAKDNGVALTRRKSGGGTIYTDLGGWQYSWFIPGPQDGDISFRKNAGAVIDGLRRLGIPAEFNDRNDMLAEGKKISGTARYVSKQGVIHHGSLLFDTNISEMVKCITVDDSKLIAKGIKSISQRVTNVKRYMNPKTTSEAFKNLLLAQVLGKDFDIYTLSTAQKERVLTIKAEIFDSWDWVYGSNPAFSVTKSQRFPGGRVEISYNAKNSLIKDCRFAGDFFFEGDMTSLERALEGCPLNEEEILRRLESSGQMPQFFILSAQDIAKTLLD